jgi:hypothetical protein
MVSSTGATKLSPTDHSSVNEEFEALFDIASP